MWNRRVEGMNLSDGHLRKVQKMQNTMQEMKLRSTKNITLYAVWKAETNHNWDAGTVISEATCAKTGTIVYHCSICEGTRNREQFRKKGIRL